MKSRWKKILAVTPLALAFTLAGCGESPQDLAKKPEIVRQMVENSVSICQPTDIAAYKTRLKAVLDDTKTKDLETLQDHNVTVCLDQRLSQQNTSFWHSGMDAVLYNNQNKSGILSLWDDGTAPDKAGAWSKNTYTTGHGSLEAAAGKIRDGKIAAADARWYGYTAYAYCGDGCMLPYSEWSPQQKFDQTTIERNPELQKPPVKAAAPAPKPGA